MKKTIAVVMPGYHIIVHQFCNMLSRYFRIVLILPGKCGGAGRSGVLFGGEDFRKVGASSIRQPLARVTGQ